MRAQLHPGHWGPVTATLDWCEANYQFSRYVAEVSNTFSNIFFILVSVYGARVSSQNSLPSRYLIGFAGCALVGVGSFAFHATLLYEAQLADELPMIYVGNFFVAILLESEPGFGFKSAYSKAVAIGALLFDILFTISYLVYRNPVYHQCVFAALMLGTVAREAYLLRWSEASRRIPDKKKSLIVGLLRTGAVMFLFAFFLWNLDNIFCAPWTRVKQAAGWPAAFFLEGHAWWHIFTVLLTLSVKDDHRKYTTSYRYGLPVIVHTSRADRKD
ncbi:alkaline phytoceramidase [Gloeopeniophorella convolvens]|nr:alkaline phytoceramidase [Gloeopeniophorella convolvens]